VSKAVKVARSTTLIIIWLSLPIPGYAQTDHAGARQLNKEDRWRQDLQFLAIELPRRHKNLFFRLGQGDFQRAIAILDKSIPALSDPEITVELMRLFATVGDSHTGFQRWPFHSSYPLGLVWFEDGLYLMRAPAAYKQYLGMRLVSIGKTDLERASAQVQELIPHENDQWLLVQSPTYLTTPEILHVLKVLPESENGRFVLRDAKGKDYPLDLAPVKNDDKIDWVYAVDAVKLGAPLYRQKPDLFYWYEYLMESSTLYIKYNRCRNMDNLSFEKFDEQVWSFAATHRVERIVIDLRHNGGGDSMVFRPMVNELKRRPEFNRRGHLFAIIGRGTFSSGYLNALELRQETAAILVGEPTGQRPNAYGEQLTLTLPNTGIVVNYSTKFFKTVQGDPPSMLPDITVAPTSADYLAAKDPVLAAILGYREK
jgi:hypothetical protein